MRRPIHIACAIAFIGTTAICTSADDVPWLAEVQRPPEVQSTFDTGTMLPLLLKNDGSRVSNREQWSARKQELIDAWQEFLGPDLTSPKDNTFTVTNTQKIGKILRELIRYECEPGLFVDAYLLRPDDAGQTRRPGLVVLHHTTAATIDEVAGVSSRDSRQLGWKMAERGFIVICPRCFLWQDAENLNNAVDKFRARHPQSLGMRKMLFDARRAVDVLSHRSDVDPARIGAMGHSLGAKETLYLAAFDDRIKAAVASEGGLCLKSTNWDAPWYLGPKINDESLVRNHHELLALIAPRAFLVVGGEAGPGAADGDRSWPHISAASEVYRLFNDHPRLGLLNHHKGHEIPGTAFQKMAEWLEVYLGTQKTDAN
jgi:dienelactone hydrolase